MFSSASDQGSEGRRGGPFSVTYDVFVGSLPNDAQQEELQEVFSAFGEVQSVTLTDGKTGGHVAFVRYKSEDEANRAMGESSRLLYKGRTLFIKRAERKKKDGGPGRSGGGFGGGGGGFGAGGDRKKDCIGLNPNKPDLVPAKRPSFHSNRGDGTEGITRQETVLVTHIEGPCALWCQGTEDAQANEMMEITENLAALCPSGRSCSGKPLPNKTYAAKFSVDGQWYRCQTVNVTSDTQCEVQYIDYGNGEVVDNSSLVELPPAVANLKPHATKYILYGLKPCYFDRNEVGFAQGVELLRKLTEGQVVVAKVYGTWRVANAFPVILEVKGTDVNQEILNAGFAERRVPARGFGQGPPQGQGQGQGPWSAGRRNLGRGLGAQPGNGGGGEWSGPADKAAPPKRGVPMFPGPHAGDSGGWQRVATPDQLGGGGGGGGGGVAMGTTPNDGCGAPPTIGTWEAPTPTSTPAPAPSGGMSDWQQPGGPPPGGHEESFVASDGMEWRQGPVGRGGGGGDGRAEARVRQLEAELAQAQQEVCRLRGEVVSYQNAASMLQGLRNDRDEALVDQARLRGELKNLQCEFSMMKTHLQETGNLKARVKTLLLCVNRVRKCRQQFPTEQQTEDLVEQAFSLLEGRVQQVPGGPEQLMVEEALKVYSGVQDEMRATQEKDTVGFLTSARNTARQCLYDSLDAFLSTTQDTSREGRQTRLQEVLASVRETYAVFLRPEVKDTLAFSDAVSLYRDWKMRKLPELRECRAFTNACHSSMSGALVVLRQELSLETLPQEEDNLYYISLDEPLKKFQKAVSQELSLTDFEKKDDSGIITVILKTLIRDIEQEIDQNGRFVALRSHYHQLSQELSQWLDASPDLSKLWATRKTIKSLKSKLRHKLADRQDLEESDDSNAEDVEAVEGELTALRTQLQAAFAEEEELLMWLAKLNETHFPELCLENPDLSISTVSEYGGLVKLSRSLECYGTEVLPEKPSVRKAEFGGQPVIIKEFTLDDSLGIKKGDFLRRVLAYRGISSPHLLPVDAIFFAKGERHAYLQLPRMQRNLQHLVHEGPHTGLAMYRVLKGVLSGLKALHEAKLVHGAVHLNNVLVDPEGFGVLAEFDFSKSLQQRAERTLTTDSGLRFCAPEVQAASRGEVSRASDVYNLGLLALWLHWPGEPIPMTTSGTPQLAHLQIQNPGLLSVLQVVLAENPAQRPPAAELATHPYFSAEPRSRSPSPSTCVAPDSIQLGPKPPSPPLAERGYSGILKNGTPPPLAPTDRAPHFPPVGTDPAALRTHSPGGAADGSPPSPGVAMDAEVAMAFADQLARSILGGGYTLDEAPPLESIDDDSLLSDSLEQEDGGPGWGAAAAAGGAGSPARDVHGGQELLIPDITVQPASPVPPPLRGVSQGMEGEQIEGVPPEDLQTEGVQAEGVEPQDVQLEDVQSECVQGEGVQMEDVQLEGVHSEGVQPDVVQSEDVHTEGAQLEGVQLDGVQTEGVQPEDVQREGVQAEGEQPEGVQPEDVRSEGVQPEGIQPEGVQPEGVQPEGVQPESVQPEGVQLEGVVSTTDRVMDGNKMSVDC